MIVISFKPGRLGNRILVASHIIHALSQSKIKHTLFLPFFDDYYSYFDFSSNDPLCRFPQKKNPIKLRSRLVRKVIFQFWYRLGNFFQDKKIPFVKVIDIGYNEMLDTRKPDFKDILKKNKLIFIKGFWFKSNLEKNNNFNLIQSFFSLSEKIENTVKVLEEKFFDSEKTIVGVHIRRTDYKDLLNGKYFFDLDTYIVKMIEVQKSLKEDIKFLIFSDEDLKNLKPIFSKFNFEVVQGNEIEDFYFLSKCNLIIGPPSTFTITASLLGNSRLGFIESKNKKITEPKVFPFSTYFEIIFEDFIRSYKKIKF